MNRKNLIRGAGAGFLLLAVRVGAAIISGGELVPHMIGPIVFASIGTALLYSQRT